MKPHRGQRTGQGRTSQAGAHYRDVEVGIHAFRILFEAPFEPSLIRVLCIWSNHALPLRLDSAANDARSAAP